MPCPRPLIILRLGWNHLEEGSVQWGFPIDFLRNLEGRVGGDLNDFFQGAFVIFTLSTNLCSCHMGFIRWVLLS